jgi:hypothetical protein
MLAQVEKRNNADGAHNAGKSSKQRFSHFSIAANVWFDFKYSGKSQVLEGLRLYL